MFNLFNKNTETKTIIKLEDFSFIYEGYLYDTNNAEIIKEYTLKDKVSPKSFRMNCLSGMAMGEVFDNSDERIVLNQTKNDKWFAIYYSNGKVQEYSVLEKRHLGRIFDDNNDRESYEKYIGEIRIA